MESNTTSLFDQVEIDAVLIENTLKDVCEALEERQYNSINQIVGYLASGDPGYISNHREARTKITKIDRIKIIDALVRNYINNIK